MTARLANNFQDTASPEPTRILIIDDDRDILISLKDILELEIKHCHIDLAKDTRQAICLAQKTKPDITLLDIKIGMDNGLDLVPALKDINQDILCIIMTAYRDNNYTVKAVRFGANDYLYKPINPAELIQSVQRLLHHKHLKQEAKKAESRFRAIFEQASQWLYLIDDKGHLIDANQSAISFIGQPKYSLIGNALWDIRWWKSLPMARRSIQTGLSYVIEGQTYSDEINFGKNGLTFDVSMKPVIEDSNEIKQIVVECRNITERKKSENEIKSLYATLEKKVSESTLELKQTIPLLKQEVEQRKKAEALIKKVKEQAEQASMAKSDFMNRMNHELRTPMNAILGFSQLLNANEKEPLTPTQADYINEILKAGYHLLDIINDVLELSKLESGKYIPVIKAVHLNDVLQECLSLLEPLRKKRNILIHAHAAISGDWNVMAEGKYLQQSLLNIISNGINYNREGGEVRIFCQPNNKGRLRINITDTGCGIRPDDQDLLFQAFERIDKQYEVAGVGIGLAVAKSLVEAMGGSIGFESIVGKGSTFWIELDLAKSR